MCGNFPSIHQKLKATMLLLSLCLMMVGTCPIQKFLSDAFSVSIETAKQPSISVSSVNSTIVCAYGEDVMKTSLTEQSRKSSNTNALLFFFISTLPYLLATSGKKRADSGFKKEDPIVTTVPLFLRNQVFRI